MDCMTRVTSTGYSSRQPLKTRNLKQHMAEHKKLEIGQILKYDTNGYRRRGIRTDEAVNSGTAATVTDAKGKSAPEQVEQPKPQNGAEKPAVQTNSKPETAQTITQENVQTQNKKTDLSNPETSLKPETAKPAAEEKPQATSPNTNKPTVQEKLQTGEQNTAKPAETPKTDVKPANNNIVLNERGTYDVKIKGEPTRTFSSEADAKKFLDNMTKPKSNNGAIVLNERGTYDVKIKGEPTRTFTSQTDAQKFLNNMETKANPNPAASVDNITGNNGSKIADAGQKAAQEIKASTKPAGNLTPIEAGKAPFNKKFWGNGEIKLEADKLNYKPQQPVVQLGAKPGLTPINPAKAPFNKKFWGNGEIKLEADKLNYKPQQPVVQLGAKPSLTPIDPAKAPFNKNFWGNGEIKLEADKLNYKPQQPVVQLGAKPGLTPIDPAKAPFNKKFWGNGNIKPDASNLSYKPQSGKVVLGKPNAGKGKFSLSGLFKGKSTPKILKTKGGKFGAAAAAVVAVGAGLYAAASAVSTGSGYTTTNIQSPKGYVDLLRGYEQIHGGNESERLAKIIA